MRVTLQIDGCKLLLSCVRVPINGTIDIGANISVTSIYWFDIIRRNPALLGLVKIGDAN